VTRVSVATWNLHQAMDRRPINISTTWRYLEEQIRPTVALVQEALANTIPPTEGGSINSEAENVPYQAAIVAYAGRLERIDEVFTKYSSRQPFPLRPSIPGAFAVARVLDLPGTEPFIAISLYGRMAPIYAQTTVLHAVADLIPLFDASPKNRLVVLGGDLNVYDQTRNVALHERWKAIVATVEALGMVNLFKLTQPERGPSAGCLCGDAACYHVETFRHRRQTANSPGLMTDYLFATKALADRLVELEVWNDRPDVWTLSDHCPVVAHFEF
jgi:hypothetical protein